MDTSRSVLILPVGQTSDCDQSGSPDGQIVLALWDVEQLRQPCTSFCEVRTDLPEAPQARSHGQALLNLAGIHEPLECRSQVVVFEIEAIGPILVIDEDLRLGLSSKIGKVTGVNHSELLELAGVGESLESELSDGLEHDEPCLTLVRIPGSDEAAANQRLKAIDDIDTECAVGVGYRLYII